MSTERLGRTGRAHPILEILDAEGRTVAGVARMTKFSRTYLSLVFNGRLPTTAKVRSACAKALGRDESELFHDSTTPSTEAA